MDKLQSVLDESTKARKVSVQLKGMEFADQLAKELLKHSSTMEDLYGELKKATNQPQPDEQVILKIMEKVEACQNWFKKAEARVGKFYPCNANQRLLSFDVINRGMQLSYYLIIIVEVVTPKNSQDILIQLGTIQLTGAPL